MRRVRSGDHDETLQGVNFCANCGVKANSVEIDRQEHLSVGVSLLPDEVGQFADGEELPLTRPVANDHNYIVHLMKPPDNLSSLSLYLYSWQEQRAR